MYAIAKALLPSLDLSQLNIAYYASLANFYTIYDLRRFSPGQSNLYLLCYTWQRYRQLTDNVVEAFGYHMWQLEDGTKAVANQQAAKIHNERQQATPQVGELLLLYVDDSLTDVTGTAATLRLGPRMILYPVASEIGSLSAMTSAASGVG